MWEDFRENVIVTFAFDSKQMEKVFIVSWVLNNWVTCVTWVLNNLILIKSQRVFFLIKRQRLGVMSSQSM